MADSLEEQRHNLTHALGQCILAWAKVESALVGIFSTCRGGDFWVNAMTFEPVISLDARLTMIESVLKWQCGVIHEPDKADSLLAQWKPLKERIYRLYKNRNEAAHSTMMERIVRGKPRPVLKPFFSLKSAMSPNDIGVGVSELELSCRLFDELTAKLQEFRKAIEKNLQPLSGS